MQITVPMGGSNVVPEGEGPSRDGASAPVQRKSLHTVRMTSTVAQPDYRPEWKENGQLKWVPQEAAAEEPVAEEQVVESTVPRGNAVSDNGAQQAQPYDALHREIAELKQTMQLVTQGMGGLPQPAVPMPPDVTQFDFFEPRDVAEYHRQNNAYTQAMVQQQFPRERARSGF